MKVFEVAWSAHWRGVLFGLVMALALGYSPAAPSDGFSATTDVTLVLEQSQIQNRVLWINAHDLRAIMPGCVFLAGGTGTSAGRTNKIMLYGDRMEPRYPGEDDWTMMPRPVNLFITPAETYIGYEFPFGPACTIEHDGEWMQIYGYRAVINLVNGGSDAGSATLGVY